MADSAADVPLGPFDIDGVHLEPSADGATLYYTPSAPGPELDTAGRPTLGIYKMPQMATLQLGAHLSLSTADLAALARKVAAQVPAFAAAALQPAPIQVRKAAVLLADNTGAVAEVATSTSSAFPPYAAVFNTKLTPAQAAQAISAAGGRRGVLFVDYVIAPQDGLPVVKRGDVATWFTGTDGLAHVHALG
jgi:hypothetical protein